jgi:acetoin utilization protein AcuC
MADALLVDAPSLPVYDLGAEHPFARDRQLPLFDLIHRHGLVSPEELLRPPPASDEELRSAHDPVYIQTVRDLSADPPPVELLQRAFRFGMGTADNPIAPDQHRGASAVAGASLACARAVMEGRALRAFNSTGGLHHAMPGSASGFCIYNDLVVAIREARRLGADRVLYVDFDVHHGDGVEFAFRDDPHVLTISFHETPEVRWPGTGWVGDVGVGEGLGFAVNAPLASYSDDESWLSCVRQVLVATARAFRPDLIVSQHGCDPHIWDPLAELHLTTRAFARAAEVTRELADELCGGRWVATGGGGYQPLLVIPRAWAMVWCVVSGREIPGEVDSQWIAAWRDRSAEPLPTRFLDDLPPDRRWARAGEINRRMLDQLREKLPWVKEWGTP